MKTSENKFQAAIQAQRDAVLTPGTTEKLSRKDEDLAKAQLEGRDIERYSSAHALGSQPLVANLAQGAQKELEADRERQAERKRAFQERENTRAKESKRLSFP